MGIASTKQIWNTRMRGGNPTAASDNPFSGSGGSANGNYWAITNSTYTISGGTANTMVASFIFDTAPNSADPLLDQIICPQNFA